MQNWYGLSLPSLSQESSDKSSLSQENQADEKEQPARELGTTSTSVKVDGAIEPKGKLVGGGATGLVELLDDGTVIKSPYPDAEIENNVWDLALEASIYRRLGKHDRLVRLVSHSRDGLVLEYMKKGDLKVYLQNNSGSIPTALRLKWAYQAAEAVELLHDHGIIHCDIKPRNFVLDVDLNLKIIDFSGSSIDGCKQRASETTRSYLPRDWREPPTIATDLFALGSTLYEIFEGNSPYEDIPSNEVEKLFRAKRFPCVSAIPYGQIIEQCWRSEVKTAQQVRTFIGKVIRDEFNVDCTPRLDDSDTDRGKSIFQAGYP